MIFFLIISFSRQFCVCVIGKCIKKNIAVWIERLCCEIKDFTCVYIAIFKNIWDCFNKVTNHTLYVGWCYNVVSMMCFPLKNKSTDKKTSKNDMFIAYRRWESQGGGGKMIQVLLSMFGFNWGVTARMLNTAVTFVEVLHSVMWISLLQYGKKFFLYIQEWISLSIYHPFFCFPCPDLTNFPLP